ncbi:MAG: cytochrome c oxidase assembly protein [Acidimicrobiales bacterium]
MGEMKPVHFSLHVLLTDWNTSSFPLFMAVVIAAVALWYLRADWVLAGKGRRWSGLRTAGFMVGLLMVEIALGSPISTLTASYFQAHVLQHLLLMVIAPPLLALGAPSTLLLQTSSRKTKERWLRLLHSQPFTLLSHPVTVWFLYFGVMYAFFLTPFIGFAMAHMEVMDLVNLTFLFGATLYWWPVVGLDPIPRWKMGYGARMLTLALGVPVEAFLGIALLNDSKPAASIYTLASTHAGGGLLWVLSELFTVGALIPIFFQWMHSEDRVAAREDARLDAEAERARTAAGPNAV